MRTVLTTAIVASALLVHQALASSWSDATSFSSPYNTNNNCSADQQSGFDWQGLATGSFSSFGGFSFSGFQCTDSFQPNSKRSLFRRGDFQVSRMLSLAFDMTLMFVAVEMHPRKGHQGLQQLSPDLLRPQ